MSMNTVARSLQPARLCRTCLIRQTVQVPSAHTRYLHTSRPYVNRRHTDTKPRTFNRRDARPPPRITVDSFKSAKRPAPFAVAGLVSRRLDEWARSARTAKKIEAYRIPADLSRKALRMWAEDTSETLKGLKTDQEAVAALQELGFDHERILLAVADENFSDTLESAYLRNFLEHIVTSSSISNSVRTHIQAILESTDLSSLPNQFNFVGARALTRHFHLHIGPTNSGKTYSALKSLSRAKTGAYAGPLRLLAHEVWERMNLGTVGGMEEGQGRECNLLTGEERRIVNPDAGLISCTVEMLPLGSVAGPYDVVVIDEIQMLGDPQRGGSWTSAVLGVQAKEIHLCGDETTVQLLHSLLEPMGDKVTVHNYERLTPLVVANASLDGDYSNIQPGDCVVTFSRSNIFSVKKQIESTAGKKCAVVYGALPPETRADQARDFNDEDGRAEVLVASDAVGMGLNLKINRMIFESLHKFNGREEVPLSLTQIKQIAGRAGRFGMQRTATDGTSPDPLVPDETPAPGGAVTTLHATDLPILKSLLPLPLPPITRATLDIPSPTLVSLASLLPPGTTFAELLEHASQLAVLPPKTTLTHNRHRTQLADVVEPFMEYLTLAEMETLSFAPVQQRDALSVSVFEKVVTAFAQDGRVDLLESFNGSGLLKNLETVEETLKTLPPIPSTSTSTATETGSPGTSAVDGAGASRRVFTPPIIVSAIPMLETLHKSLVMYIWLSYRYDVSFPDRPTAVEIKTRTEIVLEQCLARLPGMKSKKSLGKRGPVDRRGIKFVDAKKEKETVGVKERREVKWASKGEDQGRRKSEIWKNVGMVGGEEG